MNEPDTCPHCGDPDATFTEFVERDDSKLEAAGKSCDDCGFPVYDLGDGWGW